MKFIIITHENEDYALDVERSIDLGVLKKSVPPYVPRSGDFFRRGSNDVAFLFIDSSGKHHITGLCNDLVCYSNSYTDSKDFLDHFVNREISLASKWNFVKNLNEDIKTLFRTTK